MIDRNAAIEHSVETNRSGPLRKVVGSEKTDWNGYFEVLECGHHGRLFWHLSYINVGKRRRCADCGQRK